jgi:site-specific DNA-methyltransferase (adenine-specific)
MEFLKTNVIHNQDCLSGMDLLPEKSVDICVTSPPYNLTINYGVYNDNKPREDYLNWLDMVFKSINKCLIDDGHFWLNVGYSNIDPWVGMDVAQVARKYFMLQNNFVWVKSIAIDDITRGHFKPINSERFSNPTWEHLFHFTKTGNVKCDKLSIGVPYMHESNLDNTSRMKGRMVKKMGFEDQKDFYKNATKEQIEELENIINEKVEGKTKPDKRCKGNSWFIPYDTIQNRDKHRGNHPATYPIKLVEDCIKFSGIKKGGILLDPFMGSGTSAISSLKCGLNYIGYDIDKDYVNFATDRINDYLKTKHTS